MDISENLTILKQRIPESVTLVAVSKTKPVDTILAAFNSGHIDFGENRVQDLADKYVQLPKDIRWHFIGHLQTNKVKFIAPFVYLIHGVDSLKLLRIINNEAQKNHRIIDCLLQVHIAEETSKFGLSEDELRELLISDEFKSLKSVNIRGLMGMATYTENIDQIRKEFRFLKRIFEYTKEDYFREEDSYDQLSMGMSGDFEIAIEEGSTLVRIGSLIFGPRNI